MTKNMVSYIAEDYINIDGSSLEGFRDEINDWIKQYGPYAYFKFVPLPYDDGEKLVIKVKREETDEEYAERMLKTQEYIHIQEERDRQEYERLKTKFGE